ncbi:diguanylate cyclase, putative [Roseobacter sp. SK209-2-6]|uniref:sensor domain-containing diguanylate cyclase n=1 Tax=Roseobacter sp. SK209-2-6 TaxID=388739 RepID=UPI0000F3EDAA|nr:diguanylate cyclase [Roseobacter sp. SK209-2-6]EBA15662.1 diguanylate cyclase, putative [Roseobacter sp. SK209-2-6]
MTEKFKQNLAQQLRSLALLLLFGAMGVGSVWAILAVPAPVVDRMLEADIRQEAELWRRRVVLQLEDPETTFNEGSVTPSDARFLSLLPEASDIYRFRLYTPDGMIFWSTRTDEIGDFETRSLFDAVVGKGDVYYKHERRLKNEIDGMALHVADLNSDETREVAVVYVPLMHNAHFDGAIEFYTDITERRATFIQRARMSLSVLTGISMIALSFAVFMVFKSNRLRLKQVHDRNESEREIMNEQLRLAREVQLLGELNEWLQSSRSLDELFDMVARFMTHILPSSEGSIYVYSNSRDVLDGCSSWNGGSHKDHIHSEECWGLRRGRTYEFGSAEIAFVCEHAEPHDGRPYYCFPILAHGETVGLMHLRARQTAFDEFGACRKLAQMCAEQISMAIANVRMRDQLQDQSVRDPLTGLFNRRHMNDSLRKFINSSQHSGKTLSLVAVDVDHFKKFNDNHGHDAGDMVLRAVGSVMEQTCEGDQIACRPGGEEFTLILPGLSREDVMTKAELLRQSIEAIVVRYGDKSLPRITISLGVAHYPANGAMPQELLRSADEALYEAKAKGRNQICIASGSSPEARNPSSDAEFFGPPKPDHGFAAE